MTLTTALILLGVAVLVALAAQGWWTQRRLRPRVPGDSQPGMVRVEPSLNAEPVVSEVPLALRAATKRQPRLDALIDAGVAHHRRLCPAAPAQLAACRHQALLRRRPGHRER